MKKLREKLKYKEKEKKSFKMKCSNKKKNEKPEKQNDDGKNDVFHSSMRFYTYNTMFVTWLCLIDVGCAGRLGDVRYYAP